MTKAAKNIRSFWEVKGPWTHGRIEWHCNCPFCAETRGKPDRDKKLYWHPEKRIGSCKKCGTVLVDDTTPTLTQLYESKTAQAKSVKTLEGQKYYIGWSDPALDVPWAMEYLTDKRGFTPEQIGRWGMRASRSPADLVVLPDEMEGDYTNFFQARYLHLDKPKYTSPSKAIKPVYGLRFGEGVKKQGVFVCEGCFSCISAEHPDWLSVATYGKSAMYNQLRKIAALDVEHICVVYDGGEITALLETAESLIPSGKQISVAALPYGQDPNSMGNAAFLSWISSHMMPITESSVSIFDRLRDMDPRSWDIFLSKCESHSLSVFNN